MNIERAHKSIYKCDHDFFSRDTEEAFYLAGFIAADGCINYDENKSRSRLSIGLAQKDLDHLLAIKDLLKYDGIIETTTINSNFDGRIVSSIGNRMRISSHQIAKDLLDRFNITPKKSLTYSPPSNLSNHPLVHHFIRGCVDGDGCFCLHNVERKTPQVRFSLAGTIQLSQFVNNIFLSNNLINKEIVYKHDNIFIIDYCGNHIVKNITDYLYKDATIYLERKRKIAEMAIPKKNKVKWPADDILLEMAKINGLSATAELLETSYVNVQTRVYMLKHK